MLGMGLHSWETVMLASLALAAIAAVVGGVATTVVVMLTRTDAAAAADELAKYKIEAGVSTAEASSVAAKAHERAAELERQAAELKKEAETAKESAALANKQILEMKRMRRLEKPQADALKLLFQSPSFLMEPKPNIQLQAVADSEAEMFALELQNFFISCGVNVFPTDGGLPSRCVQLEPNADGLVMTIKSRAIAPEMQAFAHFQRVMTAVGLPFAVEENSKYGDREAHLSVLKKP